jgi:dolichol kinase
MHGSLPPDPAAPDLREEAEIPYAAEVVRKALHLIALVVPLFMHLVGKPVALYVVAPLAVLALTADVLRARSTGFAVFIYRFFGFMMRGSERRPVGGPILFNGATWVLVSAALLALVFPLRIAVPTFVMFMIADAAAALVGRRFGRHPWGAGPRTVEGSAAFLAAGMLIMAAFPGIPFWISAVSVVVACGAEALPGPLNDNLRVPFVAALVIFALERLA